MTSIAQCVDEANAANEQVLKIATKICDSLLADSSDCRDLLDAIGTTTSAILAIDAEAILKSPREDHYNSMLNAAISNSERHEYKQQTVKSVLQDTKDTLEIALRRALNAWEQSTPNSGTAHYHLGQAMALHQLINHLRMKYDC